MTTPDPLRAALQIIERWELPETGKRWPETGAPMSYEAAYGSNGGRDYMRAVARAALASAPAAPAVPAAPYPPELSSGMRSPDGGPRFRVQDGGKWIDDDDFRFDAALTISGDFASDGTRLAYAQMVAELLNAPERTAAPQPAPAASAEPVAEVMSGYALAWAGSEPLATLLARHPGVKVGSKLYAHPPTTQEQKA